MMSFSSKRKSDGKSLNKNDFENMCKHICITFLHYQWQVAVVAYHFISSYCLKCRSTYAQALTWGQSKLLCEQCPGWWCRKGYADQHRLGCVHGRGREAQPAVPTRDQRRIERSYPEGDISECMKMMCISKLQRICTIPMGRVHMSGIRYSCHQLILWF